MLSCKQVIYSGRVQGVGFRYTVHQLAGGFPVAGYVRNLPTGQVELVAEGAPDAVHAFLSAVAERMAGYIRQAQTQDVDPAGATRFEIRY